MRRQIGVLCVVVGIAILALGIRLLVDRVPLDVRHRLTQLRDWIESI
jgi:hypothetical protein